MPNIHSSELLSWTWQHAVWLEWHRHNDCSVDEPNSKERVIRFDLELLVGAYWLVVLAFLNAEPDSDTAWQGHCCDFLSLSAHSPRYARTARRTGNWTFFSCVFNTKQRPWLWRMRSSGYFSLVVIKEVTLSFYATVYAWEAVCVALNTFSLSLLLSWATVQFILFSHWTIHAGVTSPSRCSNLTLWRCQWAALAFSQASKMAGGWCN